jgi:hypothetical protein
MTAMAKSKPPRKGYDQGGSVGSGFLQGVEAVANLRRANYQGNQTRAANQDYVDSGNWDVPGSAKGGKIRRVAGKPIGKDDGLIPAQKGEFVVRKSAVKKLGERALGTINRGKLPGKAGRR